MSIFWFVEFSMILVAGLVSAISTFRILHGSLLDVQKRRRVKLLFALSIAFLGLFFARTIYDVLYFFNRNPLQAALADWLASDSMHDRENFFTAFLLFYTITEILPAFAVIAVIRSALPTRQRRKVANLTRSTDEERQPINRLRNSNASL